MRSVLSRYLPFLIITLNIISIRYHGGKSTQHRGHNIVDYVEFFKDEFTSDHNQKRERWWAYMDAAEVCVNSLS